jgi:F-type H+-transporting ATPase subunit delta
MKGTRASSRYAKALLDLAKEQNLIDAVKNDMEYVISMCEGSHDLKVLLKSPIIKTHQKIAALEAIFKGGVSELTFKYIDIITSNKRESLLENIAHSYLALYRKHNNIVKADVKSAVVLDDTLRAKVKELVAKQGAGEIELHETVDTDLIGGFVLTIEDQQIDASVQSQLNKLKQEFSNNAYVAEL